MASVGVIGLSGKDNEGVAVLVRSDDAVVIDEDKVPRALASGRYVPEKSECPDAGSTANSERVS